MSDEQEGEETGGGLHLDIQYTLLLFKRLAEQQQFWDDDEFG